MLVSDGTKITQSVNARKGKRQVKNEITTVASIKMTCFRYFMKLLRLPWADIRLGLIIKCLAITEYKTIRMTSGNTKKIDMLPMKKNDGQRVSTVVRQTGT